MTRLILAAYRLRWLGLYAACLVLLANAVAGRRLHDAFGSSWIVLVYLALGLGAATLALVYVGPRLLPNRTPVTVAAPVDGRWLALNSPATKVPSHGIRTYGQAYAIDLVHEPEGRERPAFGGRPPMRRPNDYPAFGEPVRAMVDGTVVRLADGHRDHRSRSNLLSVLYLLVEGVIREIGGPSFLLGNHVTIQTDDDVFATVAHLQRGSVAVRIGDRVRAGALVGRCGNSGNSTEPHVHAQLMDRASLRTAQGIPMSFTGVLLGEDPIARDGLPATMQHMRADLREAPTQP